MIGILDYGMGNLRSVQKALERVSVQSQVVDDPDLVAGCEKVILPGVGNFADGMNQLRQRGFVDPAIAFAKSGRPLMGICMGMQLLMDASTEDAPDDDQPIAGLGLIPGQVLRFCEDQGPGAPRLKVPHMGWNRLEVRDGSPLLAGIGPDAHVYFVHGYYCRPQNPDVTAATATYGQPFCAAMHHKNLWACQFHPEKSQRVGLRILHNFAAL